MAKKLTKNDIEFAIETLSGSHRGKRAMKTLRLALRDDFLPLDSGNRAALKILIESAFGDFPGTVQDSIDRLTR